MRAVRCLTILPPAFFMPLHSTTKSGIVREEMHRFKRGELHSGPGKKHKAKSRAQAIAIALSEARRKGYK